MTSITPTPIARVALPVPRPCSRLAPLPTSRPASSAFSRRARDRRHPRRPHFLDARPMHGIYSRKNFDIVAVDPFFESSIACSRDWTGRASASEAAARRAVPPPPTSGSLKEKEGKEEAVLSAHTSADPIPEVDARKASEVANANEEQTGELMSSKKELSPRLRLYPYPRRGLLQDPTKISQMGSGECTSTTIISDPLLPPTSEDDGCTSCGHGVHKRIVEQRGEVFTNDCYCCLGGICDPFDSHGHWVER